MLVSMQSRMRRRQAGFSLVEILVAMSVLVIGILGVIPMLSFNIRANQSGKNYGIASYLAQRKLEQIRSWPMYEDYDGSTPGITNNNSRLIGTEVTHMGEHHQLFTITSKVLRNGFDSLGTGTGNCDGLKFASTEVDEGGIIGGGSMNTGNVGEYCNGGYRGEDFKLVRVRVSWYEKSHAAGASSLQRGHEIFRYMFLAKF
ncbi:MAG: prepilin-type N-terminal cleavage/methylation domain-containing protein [Candidatus Lernaella stagnicola]|nr:prepilin-type N-terminal cleavage/methylation domain-containing protein [Candidatus Lernaella stagnicola]